MQKRQTFPSELPTATTDVARRSDRSRREKKIKKAGRMTCFLFWVHSTKMQLNEEIKRQLQTIRF